MQCNQYTMRVGVNTTGAGQFAVCQRHTSKVLLHTAKSLPCVANLPCYTWKMTHDKQASVKSLPSAKKHSAKKLFKKLILKIENRKDLI